MPLRKALRVSFSPEFAERRFGYGLSPLVAPVASIDDMLASLTAPDAMQDRFPIERFDDFRERMILKRTTQRRLRNVRGSPEAKVLRKEIKLMQKAARQAKAVWFTQTVARRIYSEQNFLERLVYFWGDHFTAFGKVGMLRRSTSPYLEEAIRPQITTTFADMLKSAVTHPLMVHFLDQVNSIGPHSARALRAGKKVGLNENLAREVLELHTLGVGGPYTQQDVQELAKLLTGLSYTPQNGRKFRKDFSEPGAETVLGKTYGPDPGLGPIEAVLDDLAAHPVTAAHIARKLAVHFVADHPDPDLIAHLTQTYLDTNGALMPLYRALLEHPASWQTDQMNVKHPVEFVSSACRALVVPTAAFDALNEKQVRRFFYTPLISMGQRWQQPGGPDGWAEEDAEWMTPQGLAARISWAMQVPTKLVAPLPDPRDFVHHALGDAVPKPVAFAASAAESRAEAIGLVLTSPAFQRR